MYKRLCIVFAAVFMASILAACATAATKNSSAKSKSPAKKVAAKPALPKLLDLGADKCIPCKMMIPVLDDLKKEYKGKLEVEFIDVWKNPKASAKYKVKAIPTQILYDAKGKELSRHQGFYPKADILAEFKKHGIKLSK